MGFLNDRFLFTSGRMKFGSSKANRWDKDARGHVQKDVPSLSGGADGS